MLADLAASGKSLLLLGRPGVGKTTAIRDLSRSLAGGSCQRRVVVVDTSNEIGGDGDVPHPGIGNARRMQACAASKAAAAADAAVSTAAAQREATPLTPLLRSAWLWARPQVPVPELQHRVMVEAVENHNPEVIVIDEMGTEAEALAARTIAQRGVQLIATAHGELWAAMDCCRTGLACGHVLLRSEMHACMLPVGIPSNVPCLLGANGPLPPAGNQLENVLKNPSLSDLVGGICSVTLGDEEARRRGVQAGPGASGVPCHLHIAEDHAVGCCSKPGGRRHACAANNCLLHISGLTGMLPLPARCCDWLLPQKSILERAAPPTFDCCIEMVRCVRLNVQPSGN